ENTIRGRARECLAAADAERDKVLADLDARIAQGKEVTGDVVTKKLEGVDAVYAHLMQNFGSEFDDLAKSAEASRAALTARKNDILKKTKVVDSVNAAGDIQQYLDRFREDNLKEIEAYADRHEEIKRMRDRMDYDSAMKVFADLAGDFDKKRKNVPSNASVTIRRDDARWRRLTPDQQAGLEAKRNEAVDALLKRLDEIARDFDAQRGEVNAERQVVELICEQREAFRKRNTTGELVRLGAENDGGKALRFKDCSKRGVTLHTGLPVPKHEKDLNWADRGDGNEFLSPREVLRLAEIALEMSPATRREGEQGAIAHFGLGLFALRAGLHERATMHLRRAADSGIEAARPHLESGRENVRQGLQKELLDLQQEFDAMKAEKTTEAKWVTFRGRVAALRQAKAEVPEWREALPDIDLLLDDSFQVMAGAESANQAFFTFADGIPAQIASTGGAGHRPGYLVLPPGSSVSGGPERARRIRLQLMIEKVGGKLTVALNDKNYIEVTFAAGRGDRSVAKINASDSKAGNAFSEEFDVRLKTWVTLDFSAPPTGFQVFVDYKRQLARGGRDLAVMKYNPDGAGKWSIRAAGNSFNVDNLHVIAE
ncbi:MAG: hypothetical protein HY719_10905, partial [Planctomycetes bacterium]|nr:hypothetical protein [Planctomycetota bacterium]